MKNENQGSCGWWNCDFSGLEVRPLKNEHVISS